MKSTDVFIIGAGPAGSMSALRLAREGIPFVITDRDDFPREKICGDALSGKVPHILRRLDPGIVDRFVERCNPLPSFGIRFVAPGDYLFDVPFIHDFDPQKHNVPGYTVRRELFDDFLLEEVRARAGDTLLTNCSVHKVERSAGGWNVRTSRGDFFAKILIDASGNASSFVTPYLKPLSQAGKTALAVRSYFKGVSGFHPKNFIELFFLPEVLPGYMWIFPLPDGVVNAGIGIRKDLVLRRRLNLTSVFNEAITKHPLLAQRFINAERISKPAAYALPLGYPRFRISGDRYMLTGDAAHLVDPLTGEGVGNAMYSGFIAAEQAVQCLNDRRFDEKYFYNYDARIKRVLGLEMKISGHLQNLLKYPGLVRLLARKAHKNKHVPELMSSMFTDLSHRRKLTNPVFLLKMLLNK
ncbi:MAG TPA: geranylgeranyl reductase family protein [Bacteroidales bacterium]|nr:geranylgeranyl reductase family protein [Bacteroidales bacterium]